MTVVILLTGISLSVQLILLYVTRTARVFIWVHAAFYVIFVPLLHLLQYFGREDRPLYHMDVYALTHFLVFGYLVGFLLCAGVLMRFMPRDTTLIRSLFSISDRALTSIFGTWITLKVYLGIKYGPLALTGLKREMEGVDQFRLEFYDVLLSSYLTYFAVGACVTFVLKVAISKKWPMLLHTFVFTAFLSIYLVLGEASMGARRFVLLIMLVAIAGAARSWEMASKELIMNMSKLVLTGLFLALAFSSYFQIVRSNVFQPDISYSLASGDLSEMAKGALIALIPDINKDVETEQVAMLRSGPFEFIHDVLAVHVEKDATTHGHITTSALQMMIPYVIAGTDKESVNVDKILIDELDIIPFDGFIEGLANQDLPSSLLAIFLAEYGLAGTLIAPMVTMVALLLISLMFRWASPSTLLTIQVISGLFQVAGNVEGDLLTVLTTLRDVFLGFVGISGVTISIQRIARALKPNPGCAIQRHSEAATIS